MSSSKLVIFQIVSMFTATGILLWLKGDGKFRNNKLFYLRSESLDRTYKAAGVFFVLLGLLAFILWIFFS